MHLDIECDPQLQRPHRTSEARLRQARRAAAVLFLVDGLTFGTWAALIPAFKRAFSLTEGGLSWVLFALVGGAMVSMPVTGRLIGRWGSHRLSHPAALVFSATLLALAWAPSYGMLIVSAFFFGVWKGALDVSVNAQAIVVENAMQKPIMSSFQAFWSLGGLVAACSLSMLLHQGFSHSLLMTMMSVVLLAMGVWTFGRLLPDPAPMRRDEKAQGDVSKSSRLQLGLLGGLAFLALFSEGVMLDWSAVYTETVSRLPVSTAPLGFAVFALCMASGRFLGDVVTARIGNVAILRVSGLVAAGGIALAVIGQAWPFALAGFALVGLGVANMVPVIFGAAGRIEGQAPGTSLATVTTAGYFGFLAGPPVVGFVAAHVGLPAAFCGVIVFGIAIATLGIRAVQNRGSRSVFASAPEPTACVR
ncbi:predicted arabinose efflux permease, MFS family [Terrimicrobium sacchariphilum]|uniref:Predicted arabinose efflux permease, MFS family n=1 Tax=Terrimicrobium sacchariphilum TaxID=690879 RepID=A0A146G491_TERSA|nr:MFS transporter [Terrimicrobium sacchariphilum]GAT31616.1 predicted arabinose efflux permease, MFS family [Terrimicrobium sacchariphilum]